MKRNIVKKAVATSLLASMCFYTMPVLANTKEERVYTKINNNNEAYETIVSTKLSNDDKSELLEDITNLINIKNTNGDEEFEQNGNKLVWKTNGNSIQYQGESEKELPIETTIKYELDGEEMSAEEIVGKSGKVKVTINYKNNDAHTVLINGGYVRMYTPFVVVAGTIIDKENNENITVTKGKILDNGSKDVVVGIAMPGLQESLDLSSNDIEIPSSIVIEMDAKDFEMGNIMSYATAKVLDEEDLNLFNKLDEIYAKANDLKEASIKLADGSKALNEGVDTLNNGATALNSGAKKLASGATQVNSGVSVVATNMSQVTQGAEKLSKGQKQVTDGLAQIKSKLPTQTEITQSKQTLNTLQAGNNQALTSLTAKTANADTQITALKAKLNTVTSSITTVKAGLTTAGIDVSTMTDAQITSTIQTLQTQYTQAYTALTQDPTDTAKQLATYKASSALANVSLYQSLVGSKTLIETTIDSLESSKTLTTLVAGDKEAVSNLLNTLDSMSELNAGIDQLLGGSQQLQEGVTNLQAGSTQLENGLNTLANATTQLSNGANELSNGTNALAEGTTSLKEGTQTLSEGMTTFNEEGISKIVNYINGDVKEVEQRIKALKDLAKKYNTFAGLEDTDEGEVTFITIIDSLKKENFEKDEKANASSNETNETIANENISNESNKTETSSN